MPDELRCPSRIQARITETGLLEIKCSSKHCGAGGGVVVLHLYDFSTRQLVDTKKFRSPQVPAREGHQE